MADIASSDVTYTVQSKSRAEKSRSLNRVSIAFGDGALTYPAGGVPLLKASLGMPTTIESLELFDPSSSDGFVYKYDATNEKLRIYQGDNNNAADAPLIELVAATATPAATTIVMNVKGY